MHGTSHGGVQQQGLLIEKKIKSGDSAVPRNDEISPGVSWHLPRPARYPLDASAIAQFLRLGNWPILKVWVSGSDRARNAIDLVAATVDAVSGVVEHAVFREDLVDGCPPTRGVVFTENVLKITVQQGRYGIWNSSLLSVLSAALDAADSEKMQLTELVFLLRPAARKQCSILKATWRCRCG